MPTPTTSPTLSATARREYEQAVVPLIGPLTGRALKLTRSVTDAEDLVQETLIRAFRFWHTYDPSQPLKAWLHTILRNVWFTTCDNNKRHRAAHTAAQAELELLRDNGIPQVEGELDAKEDATKVLEEVEALPAEFREVINLVDLVGTSYLDAAASLGIPVGTVMSRLNRGRKHLRAALAA
jgi:RNA polymerase sigma-70 factor (ECF subfamily)